MLFLALAYYAIRTTLTFLLELTVSALAAIALHGSTLSLDNDDNEN